MSEIVITTKTTAISVNAQSSEIRLTEASVVQFASASTKIKEMKRVGDDLLVTDVGNKVVVIRDFFKSFNGLKSDLVLRDSNEEGQQQLVLVKLTEGPADLVATYTPIDSIEPLLIHEGTDLSVLFWALGGGLALSGLAGSGGGDGGGPYILDLVAPAAPTVAPTNGRTITGTAEPGSTVIVTVGDEVIGEVVVGPDGNFEIKPKNPPGDGSVITVVAKDPDGNTSPPTTATVDGVPPIAPTVDPTNGGTITGIGESGGRVVARVGDKVIGVAVVDPEGKFTIKPTIPLGDGTVITVVAEDTAGNISPPTTATVDAMAPSVTITNDISAAGDVTFTFTFSEPVSGFNAADVVISAGTKGAFSRVSENVYTLVVTPPTIGSGVITVDVPANAAMDLGGNGSLAAPQASQEFDGAPSVITSVAITSATSIQNQTANAGDVIKVTVILSEATTVTGSPQLALNIGGTTVQAKYASGSGTTQLVFEYTVMPGQSDGNGISILANSLTPNGGLLLDAAGNNALLSHAAVADNPDYRVDTSIETPTITTFIDNVGTKMGAFGAGIVTDDNTPQLNGRAEAFSTVRVYGAHLDGGYALLGSTTANESGEWLFTPRYQVNGTRSYRVEAEDAAGNISAPSNDFSIQILGPTEKPIEVGPTYVWSSARAGDVNGDGFDDVLTGVYVSDARDILLGGRVLGASTIDLTPGNPSVYHQSGIGDINGDGVNDVVTQYANRNGDGFGTAYVYLGDKKSTAWVNSQEFRTRGVGAAGDLDGNGLSDFVRLGDGKDMQTSSVQYGTAGAITSANIQKDLNFGMSSGGGAYNGAQHSDAVGDFNGDGLNDLVTSHGIFFGSREGGISSTANRSWITGPNADKANQVQAVSAAGDVNGDGFADVIVQDGYQAFVVFGGTQEGPITLTAAGLGSNGFVIDTSRRGTQVTAYSVVAGIGDVNGDGLADVAISTYGNNYSKTDASVSKIGAATFSSNDSYIIFGKTGTDAVDPLRLGDKTGIVVPEEQADGASLVGMFDYNGDGLADFFAGSYNASAKEGHNSKIFTGGASLGALPSDSGSAVGTSRSNFLTGSAGDDTIVGNGGADIIYSGSGNDTVVLNADNLSYLSKGVQSNDRLARVDGGNGIDTLKLSDVTSLDLTGISNAGIGFINVSVGMSRIANFERIDLGDGTKDTNLKLSLLDVMDMNAAVNVFNNSTFGNGLGHKVSRHQLVIDGGSGDTVTVANSSQWISTPAGTVSSGEQVYKIYNSVGANQGQLLVDSDVAVTFVV